jgi:uncharacterized protein
MLGALNQTEINNVLCSQVVGRLACCQGKQPYIVPVTYTYDGEYIYGQTNLGAKLSILRKNPRVCFEVDTMTDMRHWQSVVVDGEFEELQGEAAEAARETLCGRIFGLMTSSTVHLHEHAAADGTEDDGRMKQVMYRIKVNTMSGRFER